jgi:hypothetical protein
MTYFSAGLDETCMSNGLQSATEQQSHRPPPVRDLGKVLLHLWNPD